ncbi:MAG: hypothetical protein E7315_01585 [Clostridiales bacterium]|nr:hypothetical protein [Clostridiales bacterium]
MRQVEKKYRCIPFWSWNDKLDAKKLVKQVEWMNENGVGGFFMHARGGLKTEYLGEEWFECIDACSKRAQELGMEAYAYDENGWPSGFVGGKLLEDMENRDRYLSTSEGEYDSNALASYDISGDDIVRVYGPCEKCLNVYEHYSASTADVLNPEVVEKFLTLTHREYKKRDKYELKGFFTDEPQFYRPTTPYTKMLAPHFKEVYGEDILERLGLLFVNKNGFRDFRYKYWKSMQELMLKNFAEKVYSWCDENGYKLTGHYVEEATMGTQMWCCAGCMPFYEYEHIPGIDFLSKYLSNELLIRQVTSVAAQLGKEQVLTETYGCCGWNVSPLELKEVGESQYVGGVNLMCQHLLPYAEHGQRKRDYPAHYSDINPWVKKNFREFNDYFSVLGKMIATSDEIVNVAMMHPMRSAYFGYNRDNYMGFGIGELDEALMALIDKLMHMQIPHHYIDETILAKYGRVEGSSLVVGKCKYDYLIFPKMYTMDKTTEALLKEFVKAGGKVLLTDKRPGYLEGEEFDYDYLNTNTTWEEIISAQPYTMAEDNGIRSTIRREKNGDTFIYAVNLGTERTVEINAKGATSFKSYDILKDEYTVIPTRLHFDEGQSYILYLSNEEATEPKALKPLYLSKGFEVCGVHSNYFTLDCLRYSLDGVNYSESLHHMGVFDELLKKRYVGRVYLKYEVEIRDVPSECVLLAEDTNTVSITVNGKKVGKSCGEEYDALVYDIADMLKAGMNEIVIEIDYFQSEQVYYALFGENVTESLKNCLAYDTTIEAIYLKGSFGVYGDFTDGENEDYRCATGLYIGKQKSKIQDIVEDGFPFFAGDIVLKQTVNVEDTNSELIIPWSFHLIDVKVNGEYAGRMMFSKRLDISKYLKEGENEIEITLTISNRNLYGPFHVLKETSVGPDTFERMGTWDNGKSSVYRDSYSFKRMGV